MNQQEITKLIKTDQKYLLHPKTDFGYLLNKGPIIITKGKDCTLYDIQGKAYLDATGGGVFVNYIGHGRTEVIKAVKNQMEALDYYCTFDSYSNIPAINLAQTIAEEVPVEKPKVFFVSGGSEANDTVFKLVRYYFFCLGMETKTKIISRRKAFHGLTYGSTTATKLSNFHEGFKPLVPGFHYIDPPYCYLCPFGQEYPECNLECASALEEKITELGPDNVAAFIAEPVMGAGGIIDAPPGYFQRVRKICDRYNVLFIDDEVITGFGRLGTKFGIDYWNVKPDIMTFAKGLSSGYVPLGAAVFSDKLFQVFKNNGDIYHGYTFSGHPVACAAGLKNFEIIKQEKLWDNAKKMGDKLISGLRALDLPAIGEVRGKGLLVGIDLVRDRGTKEKFDITQDFSEKVSQAAFENGLIMHALWAGDIIAFSPPLIINEKEIDLIISIVSKAITKIYNQLEN
ncbi:MAG TPA: aspartate aminotransferase family protein [Desulfitobacteriaceae bacterium]|jgi:putrescine aminotransferase|nr:aspartate aminotransferase family protein [Desulfitobacteriaceae bacterium]